MFKRKALSCVIAAGIVAIAGCNKGGPGGPGVVAADDPLTYVPADTPYVIANIDPQPKDVSDLWIGKLDKAGKLGDMYAQQIDGALKVLARTDAQCGTAGGGGGAMQDAASEPADPAASAEGDATLSVASGEASGEASGMPEVAGVPDGSGEPGMVDADADKCSAGKVAMRAKATKLLGAIKGEVAGKDVKALMDMLGVSPQMHAAFYGLGLVPVLRVELAKPDNLRATIGRIETKAGVKLTTAKVGSQEYWVVGSGTDSAKLEGVIAITGKQLVATIAPAKPSDADLRTLLGLDKPKQSLADSGGLTAVNKSMNYLTYGSGYIDSGKLLAVFKAPATPLETSFLNAIGEKKPQMDAVCADEYGQLAAAWPRASFGYTDLNAQHMGLRAVFETRPDIAKDLMGLRAPMPGTAAAKDALFDFGMSLNLAKLPDLATKYADATAKSPWKCPALAGLNESSQKAKTTLTNPGFAGYTGMFGGFHLITDKLQIKDGTPVPDISAVLVIGSDNPASLLALAGNVVPGIGSLGLKPDGVAKPLPAMPNLPIQAPMFVAMSDKALAVAIGAGEDARIAAAMKADPAQQPLAAGGGRGELYKVLADFMRKTAQSLGDADAKATMEQQAATMDMYAGFIKRADITVELTDKGIELLESVSVQ
ncbi:MAG: hypothetical protein JSS45_08045 [Proteobacteria bacterium]|nr:hypothetical protein [Pseudomonadota bacterium]